MKVAARCSRAAALPPGLPAACPWPSQISRAGSPVGSTSMPPHQRRSPAALGGSAESVITKADWGFSTLERARKAPAMVRDRARIETAVGMLAARHGEDPDVARERLLRAAQR